MSAGGEEGFLAELARAESLAEEDLTLDGAALVTRISRGDLVCEVVAEARLPGSTDPLRGKTTAGRLFVYLQNASNEPLRLDVPEFMLTGGLGLPWKAGIRMMANPERGEMGEVLTWDLPITGEEPLELFASEIAKILKKCRDIVAG